MRNILPKDILYFIRKKRYKHNLSFSQKGQDLFVYGEVFNEMQNGYFVDIGAYDGLIVSNTYLLESQYNWNGICIEANPMIFRELTKNRNSICLNICIDAISREVNFVLNGMRGGIVASDTDNNPLDKNTNRIVKMRTVTLESVLDKYHAPRIIDYLSIDTEGAEERILGNLNFDKYKFKCITIERPSTNLQKILSSNKYKIIKQIPGSDIFYLHESIFDNYQESYHQFQSKKNKMKFKR